MGVCIGDPSALPAPATPPDADLIRRAQAGDEAAFTALVEAWHPRVLRWAAGMLDDPDDADDVAQLVLVRLYAGLHRFRGTARFSTWLYQITRNAARDAMRRRGRRRRAMDRLRTFDPAVPATESAADAVDRDDLTQRARAVLATLPERQRTVLDLVDLQGVTPQEAAALLGVAPATARVHLLRARRALRAALLPDFVAEEATS